MGSVSDLARALLRSPNSKQGHRIASVLDPETLAEVAWVAAGEVGLDADETQDRPTRQPRRTSSALRQEQVAKGGLLFEILPTRPEGEFFDMGASCCGYSHEHRIKVPSDDWTELKKIIQTMSRKGWLVDRSSGCLIPHHQYATRGGGATVKGSSYILRRFSGIHTDGKSPDGLPTQFDPENGYFGIPQNSALCHCHMCCNPAHRAIEAGYRNKERNYCQAGSECPHKPKCLLPYVSGHGKAPADRDICLTKEEVQSLKLMLEYEWILELPGNLMVWVVCADAMTLV